MMEPTPQLSPRARARLTGVVYLLFFLTTILGALFAPATANDMVAHEASFRFGFALSLISTAFYVALAVLFYQLFKHVGRSVASLAAFFGLTGCAITAVGSILQLGPLVVLGGSQYSSAFNAPQLHALAQMLLDLSIQAGYVAVVFLECSTSLSGTSSSGRCSCLEFLAR